MISYLLLHPNEQPDRSKRWPRLLIWQIINRIERSCRKWCTTLSRRTTTTATQRSCRDPTGYATAGAYQSRLHSPSDLWHSSVSLVTKEELSVSTRQTKDNKATKNRSMIVISLQGKGWRSTKIGSRKYSCWRFPAATHKHRQDIAELLRELEKNYSQRTPRRVTAVARKDTWVQNVRRRTRFPGKIGLYGWATHAGQAEERQWWSITIGQEFEENRMERYVGVSDGQEEGHIKQDEGWHHPQ